MKKHKQKTVFVGLSGGVDSSVAALRLKREGYVVVGVFIKVWQPDWLQCDWEQERLDAMRVAAHLDIPFLTCDAEAAYRDEVGAYFIAEYQAGRTPNPDVMCNQHVKFGAFLEFAKKRGADYIATGHYAQVRDLASNSESISSRRGLELIRGVDGNKDQTYFLWTLTQAQLAYTLLPVGDTPKDAIRAEAMAAGIPVASKQDSQGVCFLGHIDIPEFLSHYTELIPGDVLNKTGEVVGCHQGALVYTIGQRHGFTVTSADTTRTPHYVVDRDVEANTITVDQTRKQVVAQEQITLEDCNWIADCAGKTLSCQAQFRYRQEPFTVTLIQTSATTATVALQESVEWPSAGQSCVLYDDERCLGGGIIT